ncbi:MAG: restriction endonuclease subunit S [Deltaproteobacteria bacterium]|nr:restriction endonuclease subunit S [Deltaproteobacteria bacterium]
MKQVWPEKRLGDVCQINPREGKGGLPPAETEVSFVPMSAIDETTGSIRFAVVKRCGEVSKGYTSFRENDVLCAKITPCMQNGKAAIARNLTGGIGFGSTEFHVLRPGPEVLPEWVFAFVRQPSFRTAAEANFTGTAGQQRVPTNFMTNSRIPVPCISVQERIVTILDTADRLRRLREEADHRTGNLIPALFKEMFGDLAANPKGWPNATLGELAEINPRPLNTTGISPDTAVSFIPMAAVDEKAGVIARPETRLLSGVSKGFTSFKDGDVLFAKITPCMQNGKAAIAQDLIGGIGFGSTEFIVLRPRPEVQAQFIFSIIRRDGFIKEAEINFTGTAGQQRVPRSFIEGYKCFRPPLSLQKEFAARVAEIRLLEAKQAESCRRLDDLFQSLLHRAFRGDL